MRSHELTTGYSPEPDKSSPPSHLPLCLGLPSRFLLLLHLLLFLLCLLLFIFHMPLPFLLLSYITSLFSTNICFRRHQHVFSTFMCPLSLRFLLAPESDHHIAFLCNLSPLHSHNMVLPLHRSGAVQHHCYPQHVIYHSIFSYPVKTSP